MPKFGLLRNFTEFINLLNKLINMEINELQTIILIKLKTN